MGSVETYVTEVSVEDVRGTLFDYHQMHHEIAEYSPHEVELQTRAIEDILDLGTEPLRVSCRLFGLSLSPAG